MHGLDLGERRLVGSPFDPAHVVLDLGGDTGARERDIHGRVLEPQAMASWATVWPLRAAMARRLIDDADVDGQVLRVNSGRPKESPAARQSLASNAWSGAQAPVRQSVCQ